MLSDQLLPWPLFYSFRMNKNDKILFDKTIKKSSGYLEFGMGGSTIRALKVSKANVFSIESSLDWIKLMRKYFFIRYMENKRLSLYHVDIGPVKKWGVPISDHLKESFPDYSSKIFKEIKGEVIDSVLIDGIFRVACQGKRIKN